MSVKASTVAPKLANANPPLVPLSPTDIEKIQAKIAEFVKERAIFFGGITATEFDFMVPRHSCEFEYNTVRYCSLWAAMEAQKFTKNPLVMKQIAELSLRPDVDQVSKKNIEFRGTIDEEAVMEAVARAKFSHNADLKQLLLSTGDAYLVFSNAAEPAGWGDGFDSRGPNKFGHILMKVRGQLGGKGEVRRPHDLYPIMRKQLETNN